MSENSDVPNLADVWDFLVGLKETTESGFNRLTSDLNRVESSLRSEIGKVQADLTRIEGRLVRIEAWKVDERLEDHERRILRLEQPPM